MNFDVHAVANFRLFILARERARSLRKLPDRFARTAAMGGMYGPIIAEWRFCNVNREDDRVTKWIAANLRTEKDPRTLVMKLAVGRFINWPDTLRSLLDTGAFDRGWNPTEFKNVMSSFQRMGRKAYTGAYMIRAGTGDDAKMPKHEYLVKRVFNPLWELLEGVDWAEFDRCAQWDELLHEVFGMGDFMRNQIITDMKYTTLLPKKTTPDWKTFCLAGPGTNRGLSRLLGSKLVTNRPPKVSNRLLLDLRGEVLKHFIMEVDRYRWWDNTFDDLNNLSNCLCEFDKAERVRLGEGTPRARYKPTKES